MFPSQRSGVHENVVASQPVGSRKQATHSTKNETHSTVFLSNAPAGPPMGRSVDTSPYTRATTPNSATRSSKVALYSLMEHNSAAKIMSLMGPPVPAIDGHNRCDIYAGCSRTSVCARSSQLVTHLDDPSCVGCVHRTAQDGRPRHASGCDHDSLPRPPGKLGTKVADAS